MVEHLGTTRFGVGFFRCRFVTRFLGDQSLFEHLNGLGNRAKLGLLATEGYRGPQITRRQRAHRLNNRGDAARDAADDNIGHYQCHHSRYNESSNG